MKTCISNLLLEYIFSLIFTREFNVVCAREGGANTTPLFLTAHFAKRNRNSAAAESEGGAGIPFPSTPFSACPARAVWFLPRLRRDIIRDFVQKRFERSSVIATNQNLTIFQDERIARSPRLRRVSLRKKPVVWRLNQTAGEARRGLVWKAGGGSELQSNSSRICGISSFFLSAFGGIRSQFLISRFTAKGD